MVLGSALAVLAAATVALLLLVDPVLTWYYHLAWWSYIVAADALNRRLAGRSLLRDEPGRLLVLALGSVAWWTLFEAINLRLGNWYYVMDPPSRAVRWTAGVFGFATVLPGIVETVRLVENLGWLSSVRVSPLRWSPGKEAGVLVLGAACFALPLVWPDLFFPLTWGSFVFLLEPWNRRHAARSFLRDLEEGEAGPFLQTLVAGLVCGALWETWNYWARMKWIYTVPGFEEIKVFEMPLLGFLGFPPFAVECLALVRAAEAAWPHLARRRSFRAALAGASVVLAALTLAVFRAADAVTVDSFYVPVARLHTLPVEARHRLAGLGLDSPEKLLRALKTPAGQAEWSARSGLSVPVLENVRSRVELVMHRGLGEDRALALQRLGIASVDDLARWDAATLATALRAQQGDRPRDRFLERRARVWVGGRGRGERLAARHEPGEGGQEGRLGEVEQHVRAVQRAEASGDGRRQRPGREVDSAAEVADRGSEAESLAEDDRQGGRRQPPCGAARAPGERDRHGTERDLRQCPPAEHPAVHLGGDVAQHEAAVGFGYPREPVHDLRPALAQHAVHRAKRGRGDRPGGEQQAEPQARDQEHAETAHSLSNGLGGRPVGSAAARRRASSNFFSRMSF
jgi:hypothetical protein